MGGFFGGGGGASASNMVGATSSVAGTAGLVPAPAAGDEEKCLTGAATFHVPNLPIVKTQTTRGTTTSRWILPPFAQSEGAGSSGGANFEFCGGYVYVPYTGSFYFATIPAALYSGSTKTSWALYNLASDGLPGTLAITLGELDVGGGANSLSESAGTVSLTKGWYCCVHRANGSFNLWSPQSHNWLNYIIGKVTSDLSTIEARGKRRFYRSLTYSTTFSSDLTSTSWSEDGSTPPCCFIRRG